MSAATLDPARFLSTHAYEQDIPPSIADGVAGLLAQDRHIVVVTGKMDGRMSGFLADLCHGISRQGTLLRIKAPLPPEEFHAALAAQLQLPAGGEDRLPLAARVGRRLMQPAPRGRFVLLCEAADRYEDATLEVVRQLSNYPLSIVLAGSHRLLRRLKARRLAPLFQRITHRLALNRSGLWANPFWPTLLLLLAGGGGLIYVLWTPPPLPEPPPRPIVSPPAPAASRSAIPPPIPQAAPSHPAAAETESGLTLVLETDLRSR
ncbi:MAG: hypothetical protein WHV61_07885 [Burkholderiales bacterium]